MLAGFGLFLILSYAVSWPEFCADRVGTAYEPLVSSCPAPFYLVQGV
jgi:hypothetical protein